MISTERLFQITRNKSVSYLGFLMVSEVLCFTEAKGENLSPGETDKKF